MEVEVSILKGKLEEIDKHFKFQYSTMKLDNLLNNKRYPFIKNGLGFHKNIKGGSSSQICVRNFENNKAKTENPNQKSRKANFQRKSFSPNNGNNNQLSPLNNDIECCICHKYGHFLANCGSRLFRPQVNSYPIGIPSTPRYSSFF